MMLIMTCLYKKVAFYDTWCMHIACHLAYPILGKNISKRITGTFNISHLCTVWSPGVQWVTNADLLYFKVIMIKKLWHHYNVHCYANYHLRFKTGSQNGVFNKKDAISKQTSALFSNHTNTFQHAFITWTASTSTMNDIISFTEERSTLCQSLF